MTGRWIPAALLAASLAAALAGSASAGEPPERIVSLNLCTDQLVLMLAEREHIAALTYLAPDPSRSRFAEAAAGLPLIRGAAEEVVRIEPDLILAGVFSTPATRSLLAKFGYGLHVLDVPESFEAIRGQTREVAALLGAPARGEAVLADMDARLAAVRSAIRGPPPRALVYWARGITAGSGTLMHEVLVAAGFVNLAAELGIEGHRQLRLEALILADPDLIVFLAEKDGPPSFARELLRHPALRRVSDDHAVAVVPSRLWICGTPLVVEAVEALSRVRAGGLGGEGVR